MTRVLVISAPASGAGKTTLTLALARAYRDRRLKVQCFKSGPDYIDPAFHTAATGRTSVNLDSWAMSRDAIDALARRGADADLILAEGSMGLFDGVATKGACGTGASADLAAIMGWPVLLVLDPSGQAQTAAAVAAGLRDFRPGVRIAGVVLNRVASPRHEDLVRGAMTNAGIAVLGALPRHAPIAMPERHLGLVQAEEQARLGGLIAEAARLIAERIDLDALMRLVGARLSLRRDHDSARPARCAGARCGLFVCLSAYARGLAGRRGRDHAVLSARRRGSGCERRRLLATRRLSGIACRAAGGQSSPSQGASCIRGDAAGARRMWGLYGAGRGAGGRARNAPRDDGTARAGNQFCQTPHASRLQGRRSCRTDSRIPAGIAPAGP